MNTTITPAVHTPAKTQTIVISPEINTPETITIELSKAEAGIIASVLGKVCPMVYPMVNRNLTDILYWELHNFIDDSQLYREEYSPLFEGTIRCVASQKQMDKLLK